MRTRSDLPSSSPSTTVLGNRWQRAAFMTGALAFVSLVTAGCDPVINFYGSFFPGWVISVVLGISLCVLSRWLFAVCRLEPHLGPLILVYPALAFLWSCLSWLTLFGP